MKKHFSILAMLLALTPVLFLFQNYQSPQKATYLGGSAEGELSDYLHLKFNRAMISDRDIQNAEDPLGREPFPIRNSYVSRVLRDFSSEPDKTNAINLIYCNWIDNVPWDPETKESCTEEGGGSGLLSDSRFGPGIPDRSEDPASAYQKELKRIYNLVYAFGPNLNIVYIDNELFLNQKYYPRTHVRPSAERGPMRLLIWYNDVISTIKRAASNANNPNIKIGGIALTPLKADFADSSSYENGFIDSVCRWMDNNEHISYVDVHLHTVTLEEVDERIRQAKECVKTKEFYSNEASYFALFRKETADLRALTLAPEFLAKYPRYSPRKTNGEYIDAKDGTAEGFYTNIEEWNDFISSVKKPSDGLPLDHYYYQKLYKKVNDAGFIGLRLSISGPTFFTPLFGAQTVHPLNYKEIDENGNVRKTLEKQPNWKFLSPLLGVIPLDVDSKVISDDFESPVLSSEWKISIPPVSRPLAKSSVGLSRLVLGDQAGQPVTQKILLRDNSPTLRVSVSRNFSLSENTSRIAVDALVWIPRGVSLIVGFGIKESADDVGRAADTVHFRGGDGVIYGNPNKRGGGLVDLERIVPRDRDNSNQSSWSTLGNFPLDQWQHIRIMANSTREYYDLFVDDIRIAHKVPWQWGGPDTFIDEIIFSTGGVGVGDVYVDKVRVWKW